MEMLRGPVRRISRSVGGGQILTCEIEGKPVEIEMPSVPIIEDGDELIVAGKNKFGTLKAYAFRNLRNGTSGHWDYNFAPAFTILGSVLALLVVSCVLPPLFFMALVCGLAVLPFAIPQAIEKYGVYSAYQAVMARTPTMQP